jgi:hypothetical protein
MPAKTHGDRLDRLEEIVHVLAQDQVSLQALVASLASETRRGFDQMAEQFREMNRKTDERFAKTDERFAKTDERFRETDERLRQTNERVDKLVLSIAELVRLHYPPK